MITEHATFDSCRTSLYLPAGKLNKLVSIVLITWPRSFSQYHDEALVMIIPVMLPLLLPQVAFFTTACNVSTFTPLNSEVILSVVVTVAEYKPLLDIAKLNAPVPSAIVVPKENFPFSHRLVQVSVKKKFYFTTWNSSPTYIAGCYIIYGYNRNINLLTLYIYTFIIAKYAVVVDGYPAAVSEPYT